MAKTGSKQSRGRKVIEQRLFHSKRQQKGIARIFSGPMNKPCWSTCVQDVQTQRDWIVYLCGTFSFFSLFLIDNLHDPLEPIANAAVMTQLRRFVWPEDAMSHP